MRPESVCIRRPTEPRAARRTVLVRTLPGLLTLGGPLAGLLGGCASLMGPRTVVIGREELQARLAKPFPMTRQVLRLLDVTIAPPTLDLLPDTDRVAARFDVLTQETLRGTTHQGHLRLSFGLRYAPDDLTLRLRDVRLDEAQVDGLPPAYARALSALGAELVERSLQDYPVHHFKPEDLRRADEMGYTVGDIHVTAQGLAVVLQPKP